MLKKESKNLINVLILSNLEYKYILNNYRMFIFFPIILGKMVNGMTTGDNGNEFGKTMNKFEG